MRHDPANAESIYGTGSMPGMEVLSVSDLTRCIRAVVEAEDLFADVWVRGEISNLVKHASGHIYFCLKDNLALVRCVLWSNSARRMRFDLSDGMGIIVRGRVSVYEKQGQYQLVASEIMPDGVGALYLSYEQLKARLQEEGLFDDLHKKSTPAFPRRVAIITSPTAAALRDMVSIAGRRMPSLDLLLVPAQMQGADAEKSVVEALRVADSISGIDVIVLGRGGGSVEDLWTFNSEAVVRAIFACRTPVVSAIGHETDYTLADFVSDLRAPTPSAAMELIVPDVGDLAARLSGAMEVMEASLRSIIGRKQSSLELLAASQSMRFPERMLRGREQTLDILWDRLGASFRTILSRCESRLTGASAGLQSLSPLEVLGRGYGIMRRRSDLAPVRKISDVGVGESIETLVSDGTLVSEVTEIREGWV